MRARDWPVPPRRKRKGAKRAGFPRAVASTRARGRDAARGNDATTRRSASPASRRADSTRDRASRRRRPGGKSARRGIAKSKARKDAPSPVPRPVVLNLDGLRARAPRRRVVVHAASRVEIDRALAEPLSRPAEVPVHAVVAERVALAAAFSELDVVARFPRVERERPRERRRPRRRRGSPAALAPREKIIHANRRRAFANRRRAAESGRRRRVEADHAELRQRVHATEFRFKEQTFALGRRALQHLSNEYRIPLAGSTRARASDASDARARRPSDETCARELSPTRFRRRRDGVRAARAWKVSRRGETDPRETCRRARLLKFFLPGALFSDWKRTGRNAIRCRFGKKRRARFGPKNLARSENGTRDSWSRV